MPRTFNRSAFGYYARLSVVWGAVALSAGCASAPPPKATPTASLPDTPAESATTALRYGRYKLVELAPDRAQQNLMQQIVDITVPASLSATVAEALRYVLLRTGYTLCDITGDLLVLDTWPLPASHMHLGPVLLHDALRILAGPGWRLEVDDYARRVCFQPNLAPAHREPALSATSAGIK